jgi:hypothetical protein
MIAGNVAQPEIEHIDAAHIARITSSAPAS